jgi:hypothetical protein
MVVCGLISVLIGVALGLRFRLFVLIPAVLLIAVGVAVGAMVHGHQALWVAFTIALSATALQIGYLAGAALRPVMTGQRHRHDEVGRRHIAPT